MTNEVNQIIAAIRDGAQSLTPVAKDVVQQYATRGLFEGIVYAVCFVVFIVACIVCVKCGMRSFKGNTYNSGEEAIAWCLAGGVSGVISLVFFSDAVNGFSHYIAPLASMLCK